MNVSNLEAFSTLKEDISKLEEERSSLISRFEHIEESLVNKREEFIKLDHPADYLYDTLPMFIYTNRINRSTLEYNKKSFVRYYKTVATLVGEYLIYDERPDAEIEFYLEGSLRILKNPTTLDKKTFLSLFQEDSFYMRCCLDKMSYGDSKYLNLESEKGGKSNDSSYVGYESENSELDSYDNLHKEIIVTQDIYKMGLVLEMVPKDKNWMKLYGPKIYYACDESALPPEGVYDFEYSLDINGKEIQDFSKETKYFEPIFEYCLANNVTDISRWKKLC